MAKRRAPLTVDLDVETPPAPVSIDLDSLIAKGATYMLHAVDTATNMFKLGNLVLEAVENPDDGYRSSLRDVVVHPSKTLKANIPPVEVFVRQSSGLTDGHEIVSKDGYVLLEIGTNHTDSYYPCFVFSYTPYGAAVEQRKKDLSDRLLRIAKGDEEWI